MSFAEISETLALAVREQTQRLAVFLPNLGLALLLLFVGWLLSRLVRSLAKKVCAAAVEWLVRTPVIAQGLGSGSMRVRIPPVVGEIAFWAVLLMFGAAAVEQLQIAALSGALSSLAFYIPVRLLCAPEQEHDSQGMEDDVGVQCRR